MTKDFSLTSCLIASTLIHLGALMLAAVVIGHRGYLSERQLLSVSLLDPPQEQNKPTIESNRAPSMSSQSVKEAGARINRETVIAQPSVPPPLTPKTETVPSDETKTAPPAGSSVVAGAESESHGHNLLGRSDNGTTPASGTAGGNGIDAGSGRGFGTSGLAARTIWRTNREAKPIQTVRASYPPMALRMGMEGDVALKIEVDPDGRVTKAEIIKSGGPGFDEEALKAVKHSRFEPAQKDGQNVSAEFTYVYRFRLQR